MPKRDRHHLVRSSHLQVEGECDLANEARNVVVRDMTPIFPQVCGYAVGAGQCGKFCGTHRIGMIAATRIADRSDVIDVDA